MKITPAVTSTSDGHLLLVGHFRIVFALSCLPTALSCVFPGWESPSPKRPDPIPPHNRAARGLMHHLGMASRMLSSVILNSEFMTSVLKDSGRSDSPHQPWTWGPFVFVVQSCLLILGRSWFPLPV